MNLPRIQLPITMSHVRKIIPLFGIILFLGFGLYHLSKFETVDEHFWKYERIPQYFEGLKKGFSEGDWRDTRINDKPGVTVALTAGMGHLINPIANSHRNREAEDASAVSVDGKERSLYRIYHTEDTEKLNYTLRLPILLFGAFVILPLLFSIVYRLTKKRFVALTAFLFVALNPILIGISQIINPDALLWGFSALALFFFVYTIHHKHLLYAVPTGVFLGFALLSKYTANLLFVFFVLFFIITILLKNPDMKEYRTLFVHYIKSLLIITMTAFAVFGLFMPETLFVQKHFLYGTLYSPVFKSFVDIFIDHIPFLSTLFGDAINAKVLRSLIASSTFFLILMIIFPWLTTILIKKYQLFTRTLLNATIIIMSALFLISFLNAWTGATFIPLDNLKENVRVDGSLTFPMFIDHHPLLFWLKALVVQAQNFVFSLHPLVLIGVFILWWKILRGTLTQKSSLPLLYLFSLLPLIFFLGGLMSDIFVNIRYSIMLYVPYAFLGAFGLYEFLRPPSLQKLIPFHTAVQHVMIFICIIIFHIVSLWLIKPYYFNYHSILLPRNYVVTDSWGYGVYEAAQYINHLPQAENLIVWTDRSSLCQFLTAHCIVSSTLYLDHTPPDYFVFSRRGMITKHVNIVSDHGIPWLDDQPYYTDPTFIKKNTVKEITIGGRTKNFVRVMQVRKP